MTSLIVHQIALAHDLPHDLVIEELNAAGSFASTPADEVSVEEYKLLLSRLTLEAADGLLAGRRQEGELKPSQHSIPCSSDGSDNLESAWVRASFSAIRKYLEAGARPGFHLASSSQLSSLGIDPNVLKQNWRTAIDAQGNVIIFCVLDDLEDRECLVELLTCGAVGAQHFQRSTSRFEIIGLVRSVTAQLESWIELVEAVTLLPLKTQIDVEITRPGFDATESQSTDEQSPPESALNSALLETTSEVTDSKPSLNARRVGGPGFGPWWYPVCPSCSSSVTTQDSRIVEHLNPTTEVKCAMSGRRAYAREPEHVAVRGICPGCAQDIDYSSKSGAIHEHFLVSQPTSRCPWTRQLMPEIERKPSRMRLLKDPPASEESETATPRMYFDQTKLSVRAYNAGSPGSSRRS